jgi:fibronectin type 3 domain-containing protein
MIAKKYIFLAVILTAISVLAGCGGGTGITYPGSATLSWDAPTLNADGSPLTDLAGYKIYYGTSSRSYSVVLISMGTATSYVVSNLANGTYYFAVTAINNSGGESDFSNEVIKTISE